MSNMKEGASAESEHINLKVFGTDNTIVQFKIKKNAPMIKLMKAYCSRKNLDVYRIKFTYDGEPLDRQGTAISHKMEEGDTIDIFAPQDGGS